MHMPRSFSIAAAVNDDDVLSQCLLSSPDMEHVKEFRAYRGYPSASLAHNQALSDNTADVLVIAHQDVYLPAGFIGRLNTAIDDVERIASNWAVIGLIGIDADRTIGGEVWSSGIGRVVGQPIRSPMPVENIDELVIIINAQSGVLFDPKLPGYHLYGLDVVQNAKSRGYSSWVVNNPVIHHSKPLLTLDRSYHQAWKFARRKWAEKLPIPSLVCDLENYPLRLWKKSLRMRWRSRQLKIRPTPQGHPTSIAASLGWE
jgi:hypothetical protein